MTCASCPADGRCPECGLWWSGGKVMEDIVDGGHLHVFPVEGLTPVKVVADGDSVTLRYRVCCPVCRRFGVLDRRFDCFGSEWVLDSVTGFTVVGEPGRKELG